MFEIRNSLDFYEKLLAEYSDFMADTFSSRHAVNCAITAYHMAEWVWGDWLKSDYKTQNTLKGTSKNSRSFVLVRVCCLTA